MRVLFLSTSDVVGGAAIATHRIFRIISRMRDVDASMIVDSKSGTDHNVYSSKSKYSKVARLLRLPVENFITYKQYPKARLSNFMASRMPDGLKWSIQQLNPDIIHINWVGRSFLRPETVGDFKCPVVWTLHDMWPLTGGCYYDGGCGRYQQQCGKCPILQSASECDLSRNLIIRKQSAWKNSNICLVSPSKWLAECAKKSFLHQNRRIEIISNGVDPSTYRPWPKRLAREMLKLPLNDKLVMFGAAGLSDPRKGLKYLKSAIEKISTKQEGIGVVTFGGGVEGAFFDNINIKNHALGVLRDEITTALAYAAADIFVAPSLEDNLPNTIMESLMCGTPVVAFRSGGIPDMITHGENGLLVEPENAHELAFAISSLLDDDTKRVRLGCEARSKAEVVYSSSSQAEIYYRLYQDLLTQVN